MPFIEMNLKKIAFFITIIVNFVVMKLLIELRIFKIMLVKENVFK